MGSVRLIILLAAGIATAPGVRGADLSEADVTSLEAKYGAHRQVAEGEGWTADFQQEVQSPDLTQPILSQGKLDYESPDALTLSYTEPVAGEAALVQGKFQQSFPGRKAEASSAALLQSLVQFFQRPPQAWHAQFTVTATTEGNLVVIHLTAKPGAAAEQPATIEEAIDPAKLDPVSLEIGFANRASLKFIFSHWQRNGEPKTS